MIKRTYFMAIGVYDKDGRLIKKSNSTKQFSSIFANAGYVQKYMTNDLCKTFGYDINRILVTAFNRV